MKRKDYTQEQINKLFPQTRTVLNHHHKAVWLKDKHYLQWWDYLRSKGKLLYNEFEEIQMPRGTDHSTTTEKVRDALRLGASHYYYLYYEINGYYAGLKLIVKKKENNNYDVMGWDTTSISVEYDEAWWI